MTRIDHRQVPLQVLLLVDGEGHVAGFDGVNQVAGQVEAADDQLTAGLLARGECPQREVRADAEHAIDGGVGLEDGRDAVLLLVRVGVE